MQRGTLVAISIIVFLICLSGVQYSNLLFRGPAALYSEYYAQSHFPDFRIFVADASFDLSNRSMVYRLQMDILTKTDQGYSLDFGFYNSITGGFHVALNSSHDGGIVQYDLNKVGVVDKLLGFSELYPYDSYQVTYDVTGSVGRAFEFGPNFVPYVFAYLKYPENLNWEIQATASRITQEYKESGTYHYFLVAFQLLLKISRVPGYASLVTMLPIWAANILLGSTLFLVDSKRRVKTTDRLTLYISLFVLIPTFMFVISSQFPLKLLPTTAELFLVALLCNTAAFAAFSSLSSYSNRSWDKYAVTFSILTTCLFALIDSIYFMLYEVRVDPHYTFTGATFLEVSSWFVDPRVFLWMIMIGTAYAVPYLKVHRNFRHTRLMMALVGVGVLAATSFEIFHDPTLVILSTGYVLFVFLISLDRIRSSLAQVRYRETKHVKTKPNKTKLRT